MEIRDKSFHIFLNLNRDVKKTFTNKLQNYKHNGNNDIEQTRAIYY